MKYTNSDIMIAPYSKNFYTFMLSGSGTYEEQITLNIKRCHAYTVPLIYNFTFTCVYMHATTQYLAYKNPWFAVEKFFPRDESWYFHNTSLGISTTRVISTRRGIST